MQFLTDEDLINAGITSADDRRRVLEAICSYSKLSTPNEKQEGPSSSTAVCEDASAPPPTEDTTYMSSECVICMDKYVSNTFVI